MMDVDGKQQMSGDELEQTTKKINPHDTAVRYIVRLHLTTSGFCCLIGFPCAEGTVVVMFRLMCFLFFLGNLLGWIWQDDAWRVRAFQASLISNSLASWIVSKYWCLGFGEWCILMLLEHSFMLVGVVLLVGHSLPHHLFFTFLGSIVCYVARDEAALVEKFAAMNSQSFIFKAWIVSLLLSVSCLVFGMCWAGYVTLDVVQRKVNMILEVIKMPEGQVAQKEDSPISSDNKSHIETPPSSHGYTPLNGRHCRSNGEIRLPSDSVMSMISPFEDIELHRQIGQGAFGKVYKATLDGKAVAVKVMSWNPDHKTKCAPVKEALLSSDLLHPNLVSTMRHCAMEWYSDGHYSVMEVGLTDPLSNYEVWIVQEWCDKGTLGQYCDQPRSSMEGLLEVTEMMIDICEAGHYLHSRGVVHGDLTSNNVLLQSARTPRGYNCKICDFGLSRILEGASSSMLTSQLGTVSHMPPELFALDKELLRFTRKVDIYSLGMLLWQAVMGEYPFRGKTAPQIIISVANGTKMQFCSEVPESISKFFEQCTTNNPTERPDFEVAIIFFRRFKLLSK